MTGSAPDRRLTSGSSNWILTAIIGVLLLLAVGGFLIGNLERTLGSGGWDKCSGSESANCFAFQAPASMAGPLKAAGFDVMNVANNHALNYGEVGQAETVAALRSARIRHTGRLGENAYAKRNGIRIAVLGFAPHRWANNLADVEQPAFLIATAKDRADLVVVGIHAGGEGNDKVHVSAETEVDMGEDRGDSRAFAEMATRVGADLVVGSGPHVPRGMQMLGGKLIAYSTGNFAGWKNFSTHGHKGSA